MKNEHYIVVQSLTKKGLAARVSREVERGKLPWGGISTKTVYHGKPGEHILYEQVMEIPEDRKMTEPTKGAMRAAKVWFRGMNPSLEFDIKEMAQIIDRETGLKELIEALVEASLLMDAMNIVELVGNNPDAVHPVRLQAHKAITRAKGA